MNDTSEDSKTLFVTGASRSIGHATARTFLDRGRRIITCLREDTPPECGRDPYWTLPYPDKPRRRGQPSQLYRSR